MRIEGRCQTDSDYDRRLHPPVLLTSVAVQGFTVYVLQHLANEPLAKHYLVSERPSPILPELANFLGGTAAELRRLI